MNRLIIKFEYICGPLCYCNIFSANKKHIGRKIVMSNYDSFETYTVFKFRFVTN